MEPGAFPPRYEGAERIAHGGMGDVFRAVDSALGRVVAIKLLSEGYAADAGVRARFTREALAAARVSAAPNTVTIFDVGEWRDRPYIVMEYLSGGSLADRVSQNGAQPPPRVLAWLDGTARALDEAHRRGVVHRDVKPANLLLDDEGEVAVADFGIASAAGMDPLTQAGTVLGTSGYLAPEQARGESAGPAADRYALAVVAYELLCGRRPFEGESPTAEANAHANSPPPPITSIAPWLPAGLDEVFERALAKDPAARHESCAELVADLRSALRSDAGPTQVLAGQDAPAVARPLSSRRRPRWPIALAILLLAGAAGLAAALLADGGDGTPQRTVRQTVTEQGQTITRTVTTRTAPAPPATPSGSAVALNDQGFRLMQSGNYAAALPVLERAVAAAQDTGSLTEAYASYNLAYTRFQLGRCDGVLDLLDRSEEIQGHRKEINQLRRDARKTCGD